MAMSNEDYIKEKGFKCPFCNSRDVEDTFPFLSQTDLIITIKIMCNDCNKQWNEVYTFTYYLVAQLPNERAGTGRSNLVSFSI